MHISEESTFNVSSNDGDPDSALVMQVHMQVVLCSKQVLKVHWHIHGVGPVAQVQAILGLDGDKTMSISTQGAMQITVDSGMV